MKKLIRFFQNRLSQKENDIVIFDDILPSSLSPWRSYEFHEIITEHCSATGKNRNSPVKWQVKNMKIFRHCFKFIEK